MRTSTAGLASIVLLALGACGGGGSSSGDADDGADAGGSGLPVCSKVWKVGSTIDLNDYEGCEDGDTVEAAVISGCYDENDEYRGQYATYRDERWVLQEGTDPEMGTGGTPGMVTDVDPQC